MKRKRNKKVELSPFEKETLHLQKITIITSVVLNAIMIIIMLLK